MDGHGVFFRRPVAGIDIWNTADGRKDFCSCVAGTGIRNAVDGRKVAGVGFTNDDVLNTLRGPSGSRVQLTIKRPSVAKTIGYTITRSDIPSPSVNAHYLTENNMGYIKLSKFAEATYVEFLQSAMDLLHRGAQGLIIDLRGNGGGFMEPALMVANEFLSPGQPIIETRGRNVKDNENWLADGTGALHDVPVAVLIDELSASASEILSGALQDNDRGIIIGRRSFGKGLVQRIIQLPDSSELKLTVQRYYTPSGRCIQKPYEAGNKKSYDEDIYNRYKDGELAHADSIHFADSLRYTTLNTHRTIYGGGGIMPDEFVPLDTVEYTKYYRDLMAKGIFNRYVISYVDSHRKDILKQWKKVADFDKSFTVTDEMLSDLCRLGVSDSVKINEEELAKSRELIRSVTKALLARDVYTDPAAYYMVINHRNPIFLRGLEIINDDKLYYGKLQVPNTEE